MWGAQAATPRSAGGGQRVEVPVDGGPTDRAPAPPTSLARAVTFAAVPTWRASEFSNRRMFSGASRRTPRSWISTEQILVHRDAEKVVVGHADWYAGDTAMSGDVLVGTIDWELRC